MQPTLGARYFLVMNFYFYFSDVVFYLAPIYKLHHTSIPLMMDHQWFRTLKPCYKTVYLMRTVYLLIDFAKYMDDREIAFTVKIAQKCEMIIRFEKREEWGEGMKMKILVSTFQPI